MDDAAEVFRRVVVTLRGSDSTLHRAGWGGAD
jgi:hypothetical protein